MYVRVVIGTLWRESRVLVKRAMYWVMIVPKTWCHVVKKRAVIAKVSIMNCLSRRRCRKVMGETHGSLHKKQTC